MPLEITQSHLRHHFQLLKANYDKAGATEAVTRCAPLLQPQFSCCVYDILFSDSYEHIPEFILVKVTKSVCGCAPYFAGAWAGTVCVAINIFTLSDFGSSF